MIFGKNKSSRIRQPVQPNRSGAQPVFSYHAQSARTVQDGSRRSTKLFWSNSPPQPISPRRNPRHWPKRVLSVCILILGTVFVASNLFLGHKPEVVVLAKTDGSQYLLRSQTEYTLAAQDALQSSFLNSNKITVNTAQLAKRMQRQFPELASVSVTLPIVGRQPVFYIEPTHPSLLLKSFDGDMFVIDDTGLAVIEAARVAKLSKLGLVILEDQSRLPLEVGKSVLPSSDVAFITEVVGQLKAKKLSIMAMTLPAGTSELDVKLDGVPYIVKFNLRGDARAEVGAFLAVKQHLEREKKTPSSYIDVRVDNRAYYK